MTVQELIDKLTQSLLLTPPDTSVSFITCEPDGTFITHPVNNLIIERQRKHGPVQKVLLSQGTISEIEKAAK